MHKIHKKFSHKNINSRNDLKLVQQNSSLLNSPKVKRLEIQKRFKTKKLTLHELSKKVNMSKLSERYNHLTYYRENDDPIQINKEFENITKLRENKRRLKFNSEIEVYDKEEINIKNKKDKEKEKKINEVENLFEIAKNEEINFKDKKKEIESYAISKGKDLNNILNKKDTYFSIYRLKKKALEKNSLIEKLILRRGSKIKLPCSKKEKIYLEKNKSFLDGIINQEKKIKEIVIENKYQ